MKFAFLLTQGPEGEDATTVLALAHAALDRGHDVRVFLMRGAVKLVSSPAWEALFRAGAEVALCAQSARPQAVPAVPWVYFGDQAENAMNLAESDRYVAFD